LLVRKELRQKTQQETAAPIMTWTILSPVLLLSFYFVKAEYWEGVG
jgi:hypothetical protein